MRAERTVGLKQRWIDGFAIRGTGSEMCADIVLDAAGAITVSLCGEYRYKNGRSLPQQVDYLSVKVDGRELVSPTFHVRMKNPRISWGFA